MAEQVFTNLTNGGPISVYVKDGKIVRVRPLQVPEEEYKPWVIEAGGKKYSPPKAMRCVPSVHAERNRFYSENRILYPLKRVDFDPNGERNPQNRGKSGYERISWDEALDIVAGEIKRIIDNYGGAAIAGMTSSHHNWGIVGYKMGPFGRFMNMINYTPVLDNPDSWEGWHWGATHMYGFYWRLGMPEQFDLLEDALKHTEMIVFWSNDPDTTRGTYSGQESAIWRVWLKEKGIKTVFIDPFFNYTNAAMEGTWLPPRPGSDTAVAMAIAYVWITEGLYDKEYIAEKTVGFDEFKEYILGAGDDGLAKTPQWAEEESGIPARKIIALAREWASKRTCLSSGCRGGEGSACRTAFGTEWARMMVALQAMQGLGKPGISIWGTTMGAPADYTWFPAYAEPQGQMGKSDVAKHKLATQNKTKQRLFRLTLPDAILNGKEEFWGDGFCGQSIEQQFVHNVYPIEGKIRMFYRYGGSFMGTMSDTNKWVKMYQSPELEFVVNQDCWYGSEARFADIILPACTNLERDDIGEWAACGGYTTNSHIGNNWRVIVRQQKCVEPLGESKSDYQIFSLIAERLGMGELYTEGNTEEDWCRLFFESSEISKRISWEEFNKKGYYIVPVPENYKPTPGLRWWAEGRPVDTPDTNNPKRGTDKAHELGTYTGKIEFVSESLKQNMPDDEERPPMPHWIPSWEGYRSELYDKYPLQIISPHPRFSFHTHYDNHTSWLNEIPLHRVEKDGYYWWPVRINPEDAKARGVKGGDIVELYNDRGSVLCIADVTERVPKGVLHSYGCSAKYDPLVPGQPGSTDKAGCVNFLTSSRMLSKHAPGMTPNSCLCELRKWEG
ncbi:MAG: molybdopterin-dependent oxidoreductase [Desulfitobacteriia bacterium]|jgi:molybdopterin guanine dinucleotide-containing S/N-oxide reductase-like protein